MITREKFFRSSSTKPYLFREFYFLFLVSGNLFIGCFYRVSVFNEQYFVRIKIKYPKLSLFILSVILVYFIFSGLAYKPLHDALMFMGYFGTFLAGLLYPYALTSAAGARNIAEFY